MKYDLLSNLLRYLSTCDDYVTGRELSVSLHKSEKTVLKYLNILKEELVGHGAELDVRQGYGSRLVITDEDAFSTYMTSFSEEEKGILSNPQSREEYVMLRLMTGGDYIGLYELADELYISPSLLRNIIHSVAQRIEKYDLVMENSHKNGYRITGDEAKIRRCLSQECRDISSVFNVLTSSDDSFSVQLTDIIVRSLQQFGIAMNDTCINGLLLHIMIAINRIRTSHTIEFEQSFEMLKMKGTPEYFVANRISQQLKNISGIEMPENEIQYLAMHISGKQRMNEHQYLQVKVKEDDIIFYNKFLRNIYRLADVDFFEDKELRISLLNHIVPFRNRVKNDMQINSHELENIRNSFPYAYELALYGLSMFEKGTITPSEVAYFSLHLELSMEKHRQEETGYNITVVTDEVNNLYQIISFKLNRQLGDLITKIQFATPDTIEKNRNDYIANTDLFINLTESTLSFPADVVHTSSFMTMQEIENIRSALSRLGNTTKLEDLVRPDCFMRLDVKDRHECLEAMIAHVSNVFPLPEDYMERVEEREKMGTTDYTNGIAVPHAINNTGVPDFLAIARLEHPILWKKRQVSLVFLLSSSSSTTAAWFLDRIGKAVQSPSISQALIHAGDYQTFMNTFLTI